MFSVFSRCLLLSAFVSSVAKAQVEGSYWAVYNATAAPADDICIVEAGTPLPSKCCTSDDAAITPHDALRGDATCFSLGPGLIPFSGCVGDGIAEYGENCDGGAGTPPYVAADAAECGCSFVVAGNGCFKANDIPGQQWFVYLDGYACKEEPMPPYKGKGKSSSSGIESNVIVFCIRQTAIHDGESRFREKAFDRGIPRV